MITIQINDKQLPALAQLIAASPELAKMVADKMNCGGSKAARSVAEAAELLGVSPVTIRRRVKAGMVPRLPGHGRVLIPSA